MLQQLGFLVLLALGTMMGVDSLIDETVDPELRTAALAEARLEISLSCQWQCFHCPNTEEHSLVADEDGIYVGIHEEDCVSEGGCASHFCWPDEEDEDAQAFQTWIEDVESLKSSDLEALSAMLPSSMITVDPATNAILILGCDDAVAARIPLDRPTVDLVSIPKWAPRPVSGS